MNRKQYRSLIVGSIGLAVFSAAEIILFLKVEPVYTWFYIFAWWSYILIIDSIIAYRGGKSFIIDRTNEFVEMSFWSVAFWLFFELVNLRLHNWYYINLPPLKVIRWAGYLFAYATVLPGIFLTRDLLDSLGVWRNHRTRRITVSKRLVAIFYLLGISFLILPVLFPRYCFPLIWGSFIFLLEPVLYRTGNHSLLREWESGSLRGFFLLLLAGFICGGLWEFWNFWAKAKWVYTVPWVGDLKIFEMPILGFLGFPSFAVELFVMWKGVGMLKNQRYIPSFPWMIPIFCIYFYICFRAIDLFTVHSFQ